MNRTSLTKHSLRYLSDHDLILKVDSLVRQERQLIEDLIWHLQEIQDRRLYISMGYSSLFECLVKRFSYSEAVGLFTYFCSKNYDCRAGGSKSFIGP